MEVILLERVAKLGQMGEIVKVKDGFARNFLLKRAKSVPRLERQYESDMAELLKKMAIAGEGIAWLPRSSVVDEVARGELVQAGIAEWCLELELRVYRDASARNPLVSTLWAGLREQSPAA